MLGTSLAEGDGYRLPKTAPADPRDSVSAAPRDRGSGAPKLLSTSDPAIVGSWLRRFYLVLTFCYAAGVFALSAGFCRRVKHSSWA